jgi:hypothetical protein
MVVLRLNITMEYSWNSIDRGKKGVVGEKAVRFPLHLKSESESFRIEKEPPIYVE